MEGEDLDRAIDLNSNYKAIVNIEVDPIAWGKDFLQLEIVQLNGIKSLQIREDENQLIAISLQAKELAIAPNKDYIYLKKDALYQVLLANRIIVPVRDFQSFVECKLLII